MSILPNIFAPRYQIQQELASKRGRKTLLALDTETDTQVVIKLLTFNEDFRWEDLKLFEREAETLKSLDNLAIPQYLDYFEVDTPEIKGFALVQSYINAPSLAQATAAGRTFSEAEVKEIASQILTILDYLHSRSPAVIHRDIKPSNILIGDRSGNSVGQVYLIDFGSVQNIATKTTSTLTVVGTYGYMPPEQFGGRAKPASDLYSLGATLIYFATGQHPADLPETDLKIEFEPHCNLSPGFINWLKQITNPSLGSRLSPAKKALEALENCDLYTEQSNFYNTIRKPLKTKVQIEKTKQKIEIIIPSSGLSSYQSFIFIGLLFILIFAICLCLYLFFNHDEILYLYAAILTSILSILTASQLYTYLLSDTVLAIDRHNIYLRRKLLSHTYNIKKDSDRNSIYKIEKYSNLREIGDYSANYRPNHTIKVFTISAVYELPDNIYYQLTELEIDWIAEELSQWLNLPILSSGELASKMSTQLFHFHQIRASKSFEANNYEEAIEHSTSAIEIYPKAYKSYFIRGVATWKLKQNIYEASRDLETVLKIATQHQDSEMIEQTRSLLAEIRQKD